MSTSPSLSQQPESNEDAVYNKICSEYNHLIETMPKANGWRVKHLYNYNGFWINPIYIKANLLLHAYFKPHPTDIYLASFMKSGTTYKALIFSTLNRHRYSFSDHFLHHRGPQGTFPFLDSECETYPITDFTGVFLSPRLFATHFPRTLLPLCVTSCKFVYLCREPKDVLVSKWLFMSKLREKDLPPLKLDEAFDLFCRGISDYGPFWEHVLSYWRASLESPDEILFLKYDQEVKKQPEVVVRKLAAFMGVPFTAEEVEKGVVENIVNLCSFENLRNLEVNKNGVEKFGKVEVKNREFLRKGEIGDWRNHLTDEMKSSMRS